MILIGSRAARHWYKDHWPDPKDTDLIATFDEFCTWLKANQDQAKTYYPFDDGKKFFVQFKDDSITEVELAHPGSTAEELFALVEGEEVEGLVPNAKVLVPNMDWLFTIKSSHKFLKDSVHFEKTMRDYHFMKYNLGCQITDKGWFKRREKATYTYNHPKLNQGKKDFFSNDGLVYIWQHDDLHKAIAKYGFNDKPAYSYYMKDGAEVMSDKKKWEALPESMKLRGAIEEVYVLALERSQIPYRNEISPLASFKIALSKLSSSISSGWFRSYCYENYYKILNMYNPEYVNWFDKGVQSGLVKPFKEAA